MTLNESNLIGGVWAQGEDSFEVINPANGEVIATAPKATRGDVERAVDAADRAFVPQYGADMHRGQQDIRGQTYL